MVMTFQHVSKLWIESNLDADLMMMIYYAMSSPSIALNTSDTPINPLMIAETIAIAVTGFLNNGIIGAITTDRTPPMMRTRNWG